MRLVAGRLLSDTRALDRSEQSPTAMNVDYNALIDATAAASMGFTPQQAIGKTIILGKGHVHIVGVLANVKFAGAREPARATIYVYDPHDATVRCLSGCGRHGAADPVFHRSRLA